MRLVICSDLHGDKATAGFPRFDDLADALEQVVRFAIDTEADGFICLGDVCDPDSQRCHACTRLIVEAALELDRHEIQSRWLTGNHDVVEDGSGESTLSALVGLRRGAGKVKAMVYDRPGIEMLPNGRAIVALPFTARTHNYDPEAFVQSLSISAPKVLVLGHLNIEGIGIGSETSRFPRGRDVFWPTVALREKFGSRAKTIAGHYHAAQRFAGIDVVGSLLRLAFDEEDNEPTFMELAI